MKHSDFTWNKKTKVPCSKSHTKSKGRRSRKIFDGDRNSRVFPETKQLVKDSIKMYQSKDHTSWISFLVSADNQCKDLTLRAYVVSLRPKSNQ